jgi:hypothetical protein
MIKDHADIEESIVSLQENSYCMAIFLKFSQEFSMRFMVSSMV